MGEQSGAILQEKNAVWYNVEMRNKRKGITARSEDELSEYDLQVLCAIGDEPDGFPIAAGSEEEVKEWLDCGWKRIPCEKRSCPLCGRIARDRDRLVREGKDPDSMEGAFESVGASLAEALIMIKKDAERMGIDITNLDDVEEVPEANIFPLVVSAQKWYKAMFVYFGASRKRGATWLMTEAAADLVWYAGIFHAKLYRQFCNRYHIERGDTYGAFDYDYTAGVLRQVTDIIERSFGQLDGLALKLSSLRKTFSMLEHEMHKERLIER